MKTNLYFFKKDRKALLEAMEEVNEAYKGDETKKLKIDLEDDEDEFMRATIEYKNSGDLFALGRFFEIKLTENQ